MRVVVIIKPILYIEAVLAGVAVFARYGFFPMMHDGCARSLKPRVGRREHSEKSGTGKMARGWHAEIRRMTTASALGISL